MAFVPLNHSASFSASQVEAVLAFINGAGRLEVHLGETRAMQQEVFVLLLFLFLQK